MKLDQKQMFHVSQLFMAASKAGLSFDMAVFVKDASYARRTLDTIGSHAQLAELVQQTRLLMQNALDESAVVNPAASTAPSASTASAAPSTGAAGSQYVGRLR
jgi:hypothetical protein